MGLFGATAHYFNCSILISLPSVYLRIREPIQQRITLNSLDVTSAWMSWAVATSNLSEGIESHQYCTDENVDMDTHFNVLIKHYTEVATLLTASYT